MSDQSSTTQQLEQCLLRLDALEMRVAFLDELTDSLDRMVTEQTQQLIDLQAKMQILYQRVESAKQQEHTVEPFTLLGDRPPHY